MYILLNDKTTFCGVTAPRTINKQITKPVIKAFTIENAKSSKGKLDDYNLKLISDIRELFESAHASIKAIAKSCNTRNMIKNGYPNIKKGVAGSRILEFSKIGTNGEDISVNLRIDHGKTKKAVIIIDDKQLVISPSGYIEKNPTMKFTHNSNVREKGTVIQYYSQDEIDKLGEEQQFSALKSELQKYIDYINLRGKEVFKIREKKADNIPGLMDKYKPLIKSVTDNYKYFKTFINRFSYNALDNDVFRITNKIKTAPNSIFFKNALPDGRSVFFVYPKVNKKRAIKILVMDYGNKTVDKSFLIYDNKLVKFTPKYPDDRPNHLHFHYYTQDEIDKSGLEQYMEIINDRLEDICDNLSDGIGARLSNPRYY